VRIDPGAVEAYEEYASDLVVYATALVGPSEAEDVVAEAMVGVFTGVRWVSVPEPRGWLFRGLLNQARMTDVAPSRVRAGRWWSRRR